MFVILEGPDGAGKTTLANELQDEHNFIVFHKGPPSTGSLIHEYLDPVARYGTKQFYPRVVCDRWHIGERVYPHLPSSRRESLWTREQGWYVEAFLRSRGALLVTVMARYDDLVHRLITRGETINTEQRQELADAKDHFLTLGYRSHLAGLGVDTSQGPARHLVSHIMTEAKTLRNEAQRIFEKYPTYVGPPRSPSVLLVGDTRNDHKYETALVPEPSTSGRYLLETLPDELLLTGKLGLVNVNDVGGPFRDFWEHLGSPKTVALGREAQRGLVRAHVPHGVVPHPQYVRRFHHKNQKYYGQLIDRAITNQEDLGTWKS